METLLKGVRYGWRRLRSSPDFAAVVILTLAFAQALQPAPVFDLEALYTVSR